MQYVLETLKWIRGIMKKMISKNIRVDLRVSDTVGETRSRYSHVYLLGTIKITTCMLKSSEQIKNRYAFKLCFKNTTRLNRTGSTNFFYKAYEWCFKDKYTWSTCYFFVVLFNAMYFSDNFFPDTLVELVDWSKYFYQHQ